MKFKNVFVLSLLSASVGSAFGGFAQVSPPANFNAASATYTKTAADVAFNGGVRGAAGVVNVAGKAVVVPAAYRFAANAARVAAVAAFPHPGWFLAAAVGAAAYGWWSSRDVIPDANGWSQVKRTMSMQVRYNTGGTPIVYYATQESAARAYFQSLINSVQASDPAHTYSYDTFTCPTIATAGLTGTCSARRLTWFPEFSGYMVANMNTTIYYSMQNAESATVEPITSAEQLAGLMNGATVPKAVIDSWPGVIDWPVLPKPILNPSNPADPEAVPVGQPLRVPQGLPEPVPNTQPQKYATPVVDIVPAQTDPEPWRIDLQPKTITGLSPEPISTGSPDPSTESAPADTTGCGLPDTAPCKIDEAGTPEYEPAEDVIEPAKAAELAKLETVKAPPSLFPGWNTLFNAPALSACSAFVLPRDMGEINPCSVVEGVRSVMGYIWALTALFLCLGMVKRAV